MNGVEMFGGVLVFGGVTTTHLSARKAQTKVHPGVASLQALLATVGFLRNLVDLVQVGASGHARLQSLSV
jgi:precorrin-6B methylase 1